MAGIMSAAIDEGTLCIDEQDGVIKRKSMAASLSVYNIDFEACARFLHQCVCACVMVHSVFSEAAASTELGRRRGEGCFCGKESN